MTLLTDFKTFRKKLVCPEDASRNGDYTIFTYTDCESLTAYHEDTKKEYYMQITDFSKIYRKQS
jgi:hypothetical protein